MYLPNGKMKWSISMFVLGIEVTMLSFHQECDNVPVVPTEENYTDSVGCLENTI